MPVTIENVKYIAGLAHLKIDDSELEDYTHKLNDILHYVEKLDELDTQNVEPLSYPYESGNVLREDDPVVSVSREEALKNAPDSTDEYFKVPKVISVD